MKQFNKSLFILILISFFLSSNAYAQEDDLQEDDKNYDLENEKKTSQYDSNNIEIVRIKKNYKIGDGITFSSKMSSLNITQSVQLLSNIATPDHYETFSSEYRIRRARMKFSGKTFDDKLYFRLRFDFAGNYQSNTTAKRSYNPVLQDAYLEYRPTSKQRISLGLRADYVDTREIRMEGEVLGFIERSTIVDAFDAIFDYGLRYSATFRIHNKQLIKPYLSVTTGEGNTALLQNFAGLKYGVRLDYLPFGNFSKAGEFYMEDMVRERKPKLVVGAIYSYSDGISSVKGANGGRYIYGDSNKNKIYPDYIKYGIDYLFKYKGLYSMGSVVKTKAIIPNDIKGEFKLDGTFTTFTNQTSDQIDSKVLTRLNLGCGYNVQVGYLLPSDISFGMRYSHLDQDQQSANFATINNYYTLTTTKYFASNSFKLQAEVSYQEYAVATSLATGSYLAQIMLTFEL